MKDRLVLWAGTCAALAFLVVHSASCKKGMTNEECKARCVKIGAEEAAKCTLDKEICEEAQRRAGENCNKTCDGAFPTK